MAEGDLRPFDGFFSIPSRNTMAPDSSTPAQPKGRTPHPNRPESDSRRRSSRRTSGPWGWAVSLALHGVLFLLPEYLFTPSPQMPPVAEMRMLLEIGPRAEPLPPSPQPEPAAVPVTPPPSPEPSPPKPETETPPEPATPKPLSPPAPEPSRPLLDPLPQPRPRPVPKPRPESARQRKPKPPKLTRKTAPKPPPTPTTAAKSTPTSKPPAPPPGKAPRAPAKHQATEASNPAPPVETAFGADDGPRFKRRVRTRYPRGAVRTGRTGVVVLRLSIDAGGRLDHVDVVTSAGPDLDAAAIRAVRASSFHPARRDGKPVASRAILPNRFQLKE